CRVFFSPLQQIVVYSNSGPHASMHNNNASVCQAMKNQQMSGFLTMATLSSCFIYIFRLVLESYLRMI
ncbi:MAG: hypothetical protein WBM78_19705, partial [Desulfobacterales bacterium]